MRALVLAAVAAAAIAAPAGAQDVDALLRKAAATYNGARTATARFEQTLTNPMTGTTSITRGEMHRQQPNRFNVRFTDPTGDRIVADGTNLWVYLPSTNPGQ
ncbi:MAG TPA: outer membrane lipoprotein carrier protein LolA, partial [Gemmatimonadaceae bacterium]|nr:outer membrane lipoprotein carrier protein LolA [Gemmatimonadaceae bacterium]